MEVQENKASYIEDKINSGDNYILYIAGKVSGDDDYKEKFDTAQKYLEGKGYIILNPASLPEGMRYETYMDIGFSMIRQAHGVYFLSNWRSSKGAKREYAYARAYNKDLMFQ